VVDDAVDALCERIRAAKNQTEAAEAYADGMKTLPRDRRWSRVNECVRERWPKGLERVKLKAWRIGGFE